MADLCPICQNPLQVQRDYLDYILLFESRKCGVCRYSYEFDTGSEMEIFGDVELYSHWTDSNESRFSLNLLRQALIQIRKKEVGNVFENSSSPMSRGFPTRSSTEYDHL